MTKVILRAGLGLAILGACWQGMAQTQPARPRPETVFPAGRVLTQPVILQISIQPVFETGQELKLVCSTDVYRGEYGATRGNTGVRMAISGTISAADHDRLLVTYDLEVRFQDSSGAASISAAGSGLLRAGKPTTLVTIAGRSVIMTATPISPNAKSSK